MKDNMNKLFNEIPRDIIENYINSNDVYYDMEKIVHEVLEKRIERKYRLIKYSYVTKRIYHSALNYTILKGAILNNCKTGYIYKYISTENLEQIVDEFTTSTGSNLISNCEQICDEFQEISNKDAYKYNNNLYDYYYCYKDCKCTNIDIKLVVRLICCAAFRQVRFKHSIDLNEYKQFVDFYLNKIVTKYINKYEFIDDILIFGENIEQKLITKNIRDVIIDQILENKAMECYMLQINTDPHHQPRKFQLTEKFILIDNKCYLEIDQGPNTFNNRGDIVYIA